MHKTSIEIQIIILLSRESNYLIFHMDFLVTAKTFWKKTSNSGKLEAQLSFAPAIKKKKKLMIY